MTLELSDTFIENLGNDPSLSVNGVKLSDFLVTKQLVRIPAGLGKHRLEFLISNNP